MAAAALALQVLADPTRFRIVEELRGGERSVGSLVAAVGGCQPGVSRHLRILTEAGFVGARADGRRRLYSLRPKPFRDLESWVHGYRALVEARLDRLEEMLEQDDLPQQLPKDRAHKE